MFQDILTAIAILGACSYTIYSLIKAFVYKREKPGCPGCNACANPGKGVHNFGKKLHAKNFL